MSTRSTMVRVAAVWLLATLLLTALPTNVGPADACWCRSNRISEVVEAAEHVFTFEVSEIVVVDEINAVAFGDVNEVFKGDVTSRVRVGMSFKRLCLDVRLLGEGFLLGAIGSKGKYKAGGVCDGAESAEAVAPLFEAVIQPDDPDPPRFIRADSRLGARVAALDELLRPTHFGEGLGVVHEFAVCPGNQKLLELVVNSVAQNVATVEVRDLGSLAIDTAHLTNRDRHEA
ncbi:MAG: hypothetical protein HKN91_07410, partial [Acidimicrobiia bacterium]|nr:hypothetical protein [Acidimicrobiia bacterium]